MEDKTFELLTKMYGEFSERFNDIGKDINGLKNDVIRLENKQDNNSKALFDGYNQTYEKLQTIERKVDDISVKVDKQEVEIKVIKGGKA